jgi:hypothetical protein
MREIDSSYFWIGAGTTIGDSGVGEADEYQREESKVIGMVRITGEATGRADT